MDWERNTQRTEKISQHGTPSERRRCGVKINKAQEEVASFHTQFNLFSIVLRSLCFHLKLNRNTRQFRECNFRSCRESLESIIKSGKKPQPAALPHSLSLLRRSVWKYGEDQSMSSIYDVADTFLCTKQIFMPQSLSIRFIVDDERCTKKGDECSPDE